MPLQVLSQLKTTGKNILWTIINKHLATATPHNETYANVLFDTHYYMQFLTIIRTPC